MKHLIIGLLLLWGAMMQAVAQNPIMGEPELSAEQLATYILSNNPEFDPEIAEHYVEVGRRYGVRGDIAICQAIFETGWFRYQGSAVTPEQHNYCGLGVERNGMVGNGFDTVLDGVTAHIQHLYAYSCCEELPEGEELIDPRFIYVQRGVAPEWEVVGRYWAANPGYSSYVLNIYNRILNHYNSAKD